MLSNISIASGPPHTAPASVPGRTKYTVGLSAAPDPDWERHFQEAHEENLFLLWVHFDIAGDEIAFECPPCDLPEQLQRLSARVADANQRLRSGGVR